METKTPKIKTADAVKAFGTGRALAKALGVHENSVYRWGEYVPELRAYQLREMKPEVFNGGAK